MSLLRYRRSNRISQYKDLSVRKWPITDLLFLIIHEFLNQSDSLLRGHVNLSTKTARLEDFDLIETKIQLQKPKNRR